MTLHYFQNILHKKLTMVKIFVGKLNEEVKDQHLRVLFEQYGQVDEAERVNRKDIGFVHMPNDKEAFLAVRYYLST